MASPRLMKDLITEPACRQDRAQRAKRTRTYWPGAGSIGGLPRRGRQQRRQDPGFPGGGGARDAARQGNKLYDIPAKQAATRAELMTARGRRAPKATLALWSGEQRKTLDWRDLAGLPRAARAARLRCSSAAGRGQIDRLETLLPPP